MHLSKKLRGILRPKSVRTLAIGLIYGPRANKGWTIIFYGGEVTIFGTCRQFFLRVMHFKQFFHYNL